MDIDAELARDDVCERGLAQAGRSREQHMVEHFGASAGGIDRHAEYFLGALLADELGYRARPQCEIDPAIVLVANARSKSPFRDGRWRTGIFDGLTFRQAAPPTTCELLFRDSVRRPHLPR